jgi:hypothetical protein
MREVPISCGFPAFPPVRDEAVALGNPLRYFASVFNGSCWLVVTGRDNDATWRTLGTLCRERDWSRPRLVHELQNGLPYRTVPPGHTVDWHDPNVLRSLDIEASTVTLMRGVFVAEAEAGDVFSFDSLTVGVEVLPPTDAEVLPPTDAEPLPPADVEVLPPADVEVLPPADVEVPSPSIQWVRATVRTLRDKKKIPEGIRKADLARLLEGEAQKAVKAGQISRALKASYIENQLAPWGIWPLNSFE